MIFLDIGHQIVFNICHALYITVWVENTLCIQRQIVLKSAKKIFNCARNYNNVQTIVHVPGAVLIFTTLRVKLGLLVNLLMHKSV